MKRTSSVLPDPADAYENSRRLQARAHGLIPGGSHTYAKGDDQYPLVSPGFIERGEGCRVWDVDGNEFIEYGMGLRSVILGHAFAPVVEAVGRAIRLGSNFTRPSPIELECAERMLGLVRAADMVKFAKNGSDVTTAAVKLARAVTGRDRIGICADHPFFSTDDWFIGATEMDAGIPDVVKGLTTTFRFNDLESIRAMFRRSPGEVAAIILEPATSVEPDPDFLSEARAICHENGALFILDEMITGLRWSLGGGQETYGVEADLSTFGKGIGNGFSVAALLGKREIMELGGLHHDGERVFLLSTTHGAETHSLAASIETMRICAEENVVAVLHRRGDRLRNGVEAAAASRGLSDHFQVLGRSSNLIYATLDRNGDRSQPFRTLFLQELLKRGVLAPSFVISYSHSDSDVDRTLEAVDGALAVYERALEDGVEQHLVGRSVQPVFRRVN